MIISKMYMYYFRGNTCDTFVGSILQDRYVIQIKDKHDEGDSFTMSMAVSIPVYLVGEVVGRGDGLKALPPIALSYCCTFIYATILCN